EVVHRLDQAASEEVRPDTIHGGAGEERVVRRDQPIGQGATRVGLIAKLRRWTVWWTRRHHGARDGMFHAAAGREVERFGARGNRRRQAGALLLDRSEERGELIEVVLAPFLVRMMVTAGAFESRAEEELAEHRREVRRFAPVAIDHRGTVAMVRALDEEDFTHELIVGLVQPETVAQPLVEREHALYAHTVGIRT